MDFRFVLFGLSSKIKAESRLQLRYKISLDGLLDLRNRYRSRLNGTDKRLNFSYLKPETRVSLSLSLVPKTERKSYLKIKNSRNVSIDALKAFKSISKLSIFNPSRKTKTACPSWLADIAPIGNGNRDCKTGEKQIRVSKSKHKNRC